MMFHGKRYSASFISSSLMKEFPEKETILLKKIMSRIFKAAFSLVY